LNCKRFNLPLETWRLNATSSFQVVPVANGEEKNAAPAEPSELERWWRDAKPTDYETDTDNPGLPRVGL
jgi:hypothetical protein